MDINLSRFPLRPASLLAKLGITPKKAENSIA